MLVKELKATKRTNMYQVIVALGLGLLASYT